MLHRYRAPAALVLAATLLSGCANGPLLQSFGQSGLTTSAVPPADPVCLSLSSQIDDLRKEGIAEKIEKAAAKKYKMTRADLAKADQLNKTNAAFKEKCSTVSPKPAAAQHPGGAQVAAAAPAPAAKPSSPPPFPGDSTDQ